MHILNTFYRKVSIEIENYKCQDWNFLPILQIKDNVPCLHF